MMKKVLALILALVMALSLGAVAFAENDLVETPGESSGNVNVNVQSFTEDVFSVTIEWDSLTAFTYKFEDWNDKQFIYTGGWLQDDGQTTDVDDSVSVAVINNSNVAINVEATFADEQTAVTTEGVTATLGNNEFSLDPKGDSAEFSVTISGTPNDNNVEKSIMVGTITVVIAKKPS